MTDLISRADAIEALSRSSIYAWSMEQDLVAHSWAIRILQALPSAEAEWISCSERLPSEDGRYLVTYPLFTLKDKWVDALWYGKPCMPNRKVKGKCWYRADNEWGDVVYDDSEILAWMPLPKPYREESEVE